MVVNPQLIYMAKIVTVVCLGLAIFLFVALSFMQVYLEKKRENLKAKKNIYIDSINLSLFDHTVSIEVKKDDDYIALAYAIAEINNFLSAEDKEHLYDIIKNTKLDIFLLKKYKSSFFYLQKKFYFQKIVYLSYPNFKYFLFDKMKDKNFFMQKEAIYGYACICDSKKNLVALSLTLKNHYYKKNDFYFYQFIYDEAFKHTPQTEIEKFIKTIKYYNRLIAKSVLYAIANLNINAKSLIIYIYEIYQKDKEFIIDTIKLLSKLSIQYCKILKDNYLKMDDEIRVACAKNAFILCNKSDIDFLYVYFFDTNNNVRNNIIQSSKAAGLEQNDILNIISQKNPKLLDCKSTITNFYSW